MAGLPRIETRIGKAHLSPRSRGWRPPQGTGGHTVARKGCHEGSTGRLPPDHGARTDLPSRTARHLRAAPCPHTDARAVDTPCVGDRLSGIASADHDICRGGTMTHSIDAPFPPPPSTGTGATSASSGTTATTTTTTSSTGSPSTSDVAKDEARNVGQTAAQAGSQVASTAADQAKEVAYETQRQAQDLLHQGRQQLRQQTVAQQQKAATGLSSLAQELRGLEI